MPLFMHYNILFKIWFPCSILNRKSAISRSRTCYNFNLFVKIVWFPPAVFYLDGSSSYYTATLALVLRTTTESTVKPGEKKSPMKKNYVYWIIHLCHIHFSSTLTTSSTTCLRYTTSNLRVYQRYSHSFNLDYQ